MFTRPEQVITEEFANKVKTTIDLLPPNTTIRELVRGDIEIWMAFFNTLSPLEKTQLNLTWNSLLRAGINMNISEMKNISKEKLIVARGVGDGFRYALLKVIFDLKD
ncbi:MAG: hypothetical protein HZA34_02780 [Candidatus Pacebacteria bacterium]|nr:hypothetical protein [Candidatus Paceibacterota bacterium]